MLRRNSQVMAAWFAMLQAIMIDTMRTGSSCRWNRIAPAMAENAKPVMLDTSDATIIAASTAARCQGSDATSAIHSRTPAEITGRRPAAWAVT